MTTFDLSMGKRPSNGWVHFKCPVCPTKGLGPDTGHHLGIHTQSRGIHCWRCGARSLPVGYGVAGWGRKLDFPLDIKGITPKYRWPRIPFGEHPASPWGAHPDALRGEWVETPRGPAVLMPFAGTDGYQIRFTDGQSPKVRNYGLKGPAWVRQEEPGAPVVVVEGWADGLGFPFMRNILALLGVDNAGKVIREVLPSSRVNLALDNDPAGVAARDAVTRTLLRMHREVWWALYEGKDPAEAVVPIEWVPIQSLSDMRKFNARKAPQA